MKFSKIINFKSIYIILILINIYINIIIYILFSEKILTFEKWFLTEKNVLKYKKIENIQITEIHDLWIIYE